MRDFGKIMANATDHSTIFEQLKRPNRSGLPKHVLLTNALVEGIKSGYWKAGDKLPTEGELAEMTPFSLGTVQRALRSLVEQGIVVRQHGLGSFVAELDLRLEDPWHCRFMADDRESFLPIYSKAIKRTSVSKPGEWSYYLPDVRGSAIRIDRIINVNNEFNVFTQFYTDRHMLPALWERPLEKLNGLNFKKLITRDSNVPITHIDHFVRSVMLNEDLNEVLDLKESTMGLFLQAVARMGNTPVYYQEFFIPPTKRMLSIPSESAGAMAAKMQR